MNSSFTFRNIRLGVVLALTGVLLAPLLRADVIELVNGDRYQGKIVSMTASEIEFQSDVQGRIKLSRDKVARIVFREAAVTTPATNRARSTNAAALALSGTNRPAGSMPTNVSDAVIQQMKVGGVDPAIISQVQEQVFGGSSPEAAKKFNELMDGFSSGTLSVQEIRTEAQNSLKELNSLKKDLGPEGGDLFDGYVAILERFIAESAPPPTNSAATNAAARKPVMGAPVAAPKR
jgi:hypothetical protein